MQGMHGRLFVREDGGLQSTGFPSQRDHIPRRPDVCPDGMQSMRNAVLRAGLPYSGTGQEYHNRSCGLPQREMHLSLIHISEPTRLGMISYAVFCLKKKK